MDSLFSNTSKAICICIFLIPFEVSCFIVGQEACYCDPYITVFLYMVNDKIIIGECMPDLLLNFGCPFVNNIALLAYEDASASLLKQSLLMYLQKCSMYFSTKLLLLDMIALTLS